MNRGIPVVKINYQDMGNWAWKKTSTPKPFLHLHIFSRATNAEKQIWPESVYSPDGGTGFCDGFKPLMKKLKNRSKLYWVRKNGDYRHFFIYKRLLYKQPF